MRDTKATILEPRSGTGWITAVIDGRWVQAKVYDEGSRFGIGNGRVSKLSIGKTDRCDSSRNFFDQMCYHYDRGLDFEAPKGLVKRIVDWLEALPKSEPSVAEGGKE